MIFYGNIQIPRISGNFDACADSAYQALFPRKKGSLGSRLDVDSPWRRLRLFFFFLEIGFAGESSLYPAASLRRLFKAIAAPEFSPILSISTRSNAETISSLARQRWRARRERCYLGRELV